MNQEELKLNCVQVACSVVGVYSGDAACTADGTINRPSVEDVIAKAEKIYDWVKNA